MSYEPIILIRVSDLLKEKDLIEKQRDHYETIMYSSKNKKRREAEDMYKIYNYLHEACKQKHIKFAEIELILIKPELTSFNAAIRQELTRLKIEYQVDY